MGETIIPDAVQTEVTEAPDVVAEAQDPVVAETVSEPESLADKTLAELVGLFESLEKSLDRMKRSKEAEAIKSAFYKKLNKEKAEAGEAASVEPTEAEEVQSEQTVEDSTSSSPFDAVEAAFKGLYADYKKERAEYNRQQDAEREANYNAKLAVIEDLKALNERQEVAGVTFPEFRAIQDRWKAIGPVPAQKFREVNDQYQFQVERFYDMVKINDALRDLDFKKNLEAKIAFCEAAEKLADNDNVVEAFHELQKLHEQWKEFGPVAKEFREDIWNRFKAATSVVSKRYQAHFEGLKGQQEENLAAKEALCVKVEEIASMDLTSSSEWNTQTKEIERIQAEWKTIGFVAKKDNQKIYERFRAACDAFFAKKRDFYAQYKDSMNVNLERKMAIVEQAEALKSSTDWKKATDQFIELQKKWKEIGAVPRKKSEQLWKRFRGACDEFFAERDKNAKPAENDYYGNLRLKKKLIEDIKAYTLTGDSAADEQAYKDFAAKWQSIGFVPFKEKDNIAAAYREAVDAKFAEFARRGGRGRAGGYTRTAPKPRSERDILVQKYNALQQDIVTYENNIGFFAASKNAEALIGQMQSKIDAAKSELKAMEAQIRNLDTTSEQSNG